MALKINWNATNIYKGGAYSKYSINNGGIYNLGPTGIVAIFGESTSGTPGSSEDIINNWYTADQLPEIKSIYGSGSIVDACNFLFAPGNDAAIPGGAQAVYIYKTNASTRASLTLASSYGTVYATNYGLSGNMTTYKNTLTLETAAYVRTATAGVPDTFDLTTNPFADGSSFSLHIDGSERYTWSDAHASAIATVVALTSSLMDPLNWTSPSGGTPFALPFEVRLAPNHVSDAQAAILITMDDESSFVPVYTQRTTHSRTLELIDGFHTPLAVAHLAAGFKTPTVEAKALIELKDISTTETETDTLGGNVVLQVGYSDITKNSATVEVTDDEVILSVDGTEVATFAKTAYNTLITLVTAINLVPDWSASLTSAVYNSQSVDILDTGISGAISATQKPARFRKNAYEVAQFFAQSNLATIENQATTALPDALIQTTLSGGAIGATSTADITNALAALSEIDVNIVVPLFSRDAVNDISDSLTDINSTYTISGINQAVKTHLALMGTTKKRSERQAVCSFKDTYDNVKIHAGVLSDGKIQLTMQDIKQVDSNGVLKWFQPWSLACLIAGARCGSTIGTPLLFKFLNCSGIRQTAQPMITAEEDIVEDFNPRTQYEDAIIAGITFLERPQTGGFRVVCDNTTFSADDVNAGWVWNRGNVVYTAFVFMKDFRRQIESAYVGKKNTVSVAEIKSTCDSVLRVYLGQGITVSTADAPSGYKNLSVRIEGNTIYISVTIILVEGIEWALLDLQISRAISNS